MKTPLFVVYPLISLVFILVDQYQLLHTSPGCTKYWKASELKVMLWFLFQIPKKDIQRHIVTSSGKKRTRFICYLLSSIRNSTLRPARQSSDSTGAARVSLTCHALKRSAMFIGLNVQFKTLSQMLRSKRIRCADGHDYLL